jgi:hypothetical protein
LGFWKFVLRVDSLYHFLSLNRSLALVYSLSIDLSLSLSLSISNRATKSAAL